MSEADLELHKDLLRGADEIAEFVFGDRKHRRKVYHLVATSRMPTFKIGSMICARKSVLLQWIAEQEKRHAPNFHAADRSLEHA
ncbi:MAG TPA: DNA-binding protein [Xanthobacteraceae bacterium]|jgi:hypothetical protein|nr:DNA-binding protein [Xanthobacteraceae bacterium]